MCNATRMLMAARRRVNQAWGPPHSTLAPVLGHAQTAEGGQARNLSLAASIGAALAGNAAGPCAWLLPCLIDGYV